MKGMSQTESGTRASRTRRLTRRWWLLLAAGLLALAAVGCGAEEPETEEVENTMETEAAAEGASDLALTSSAFGEGERIPERYTCDGEDVSPPLAWEGAPAGTVAYALIMDDPDAPRGTWVHWVLFNLPQERNQLPEDVSVEVGTGGRNSWDRTGYGGPCPPSGQHRYVFKLYALNTELALETGADKEALLAAMEGHIVASGQLIGVYER